ncbi:MAG: SDR family oxidoreductase [Clostridia bacterium]
MKTVLITGSSRGIGAKTAEVFALNGWNVVINYNKNKTKADILAGYLSQYCNVMTIQCDVSKPEEVAQMFATIAQTFGRIDVLVNNAGITKEDMLIDLSTQDITDIITTNLLGTIICSQHALMQFDGRGKIINISSCQGELGASCESVYSATKAGITAFSKSISAEYEDSDIQVYDLPLGWVDTDMTAHYTDAERIDFLQANPNVQYQSADEVAQQIYNLATN